MRKRYIRNEIKKFSESVVEMFVAERECRDKILKLNSKLFQRILFESIIRDLTQSECDSKLREKVYIRKYANHYNAFELFHNSLPDKPRPSILISVSVGL